MEGLIVFIGCGAALTWGYKTGFMVMGVLFLCEAIVKWVVEYFDW